MQIPLDSLHLPEKDLRATIDEDSLQELADSMRDVGQLQPIGVIGRDDGTFEVVFGARRTRAARILGWSHIEGSLVKPMGEHDAAAKKLIENVQRENLTPIEEAYGLIELIGAAEIDIRKLQRATGKSREWLRTRLELLDMPEDIQGAVQAGVIGLGVAKALGKIEDDEVRRQYTEYAVENGCTAEQAAVWANSAVFASQGIASIRQFDEEQIGENPQPQIVDQKWHCFSCGTLKSWREVNTLAVCSPCQSSIAAARDHRRQDNEEKRTMPGAYPY